MDNDTTVPVKTCRKCGIQYPATKEHFWGDKRTQDGLRSACIPCEKPSSNARYHNRKDIPEVKAHKSMKRHERYEAVKSDAVCYQELKDSSNLYRRTRYQTDNAHVERMKQLGRERYERDLQNPEWVEAERKRKIESANRCKELDPEGFAKRRRIAVRKHRAKEGGNELQAARIRAYQLTPHGALVFRAHAAKRRSLKRGAVSDLTYQQWGIAVRYFNHVCVYCGKPETFRKSLIQEHYIPLSKGGGFTVTNILPSCNKCNGSKKDRDVIEWLNSKFGEAESASIHKRIQSYFDLVKGQTT